MTKITKTVRNTIAAILKDSSKWDESTMRISRDGMVTALKDADKTFEGNDPRRYNVDYVDSMVTADGGRRPGY